MANAMRSLSRRGFLRGAAALGGVAVGYRAPRAVWGQGTAPAVIVPDKMRPAVLQGVQSGDVTDTTALCLEPHRPPARMSSSGRRRVLPRRHARRRPGGLRTPTSPPRSTSRPAAGEPIFYRVVFEDPPTATR